MKDIQGMNIRVKMLLVLLAVGVLAGGRFCMAQGGNRRPTRGISR